MSLAETKTHYRACNLCEAICGLVIKTAGDDIVSIKGDPKDPLSRGHICPKAVALKDIHNDPDRLRQPLRRLRHQGDGSEWQAISWNEAFDIVANQLVTTQREFGSNAVAVYLGNPSVHNYGVLTHQGALFTHLRTQNRYTATSVDQLPHHLSSLWMYGHKDLIPVPDIDNTDHMIILGGNPIASNGSIWTVPDVAKRFEALKARGGKLVVIDPRRSETAKVATEYHAIKPGSDALLLAAILRTLFERYPNAATELDDIAVGVENVKTAVEGFTPDVVAARTGIDAETIQRLADEFAAASSAVCYGRMGVSVQSFGTLNHWLIQMINLVSGNFNQIGGALFTHPAAFDPASSRPGTYGSFRSRVSGLSEAIGEIPVAALAEEILENGEGQIRALFTCAGNPVLSTPNGQQLDKALASLEFMVSLDPYLNETTRHADIILPPTAPLEHDHYDIAFHSLAVRNTSRYNPAIFEKPEGTRHDWEIFAELGARVADRLGKEPRAQVPPAEIIDKQLRNGRYSEAAGHPAKLSLETLRSHPHGIDLGALRESSRERLLTADNKVQCAVEPCLQDLDRAAVLLSEESKDQLLLIGRRHVRSNNSWMHNYHRLVKGKSRSHLMMHSDDMAARGIGNGARVELRSRAGAIEVSVERCDDMMPGVVSLPHGYGHQRKGVRLGIAAGVDGASLNDVTDEKDFDKISGNAVLNGVPVNVSLVKTSPEKLPGDTRATALA